MLLFIQPKYINAQKMTNHTTPIGLLELRNYIIHPGMREPFIDYFEHQLIIPQVSMGGYPLGQYRVKNEDDHFFWIRGFTDMASRGKFLREFYLGPEWKKHKGTANPMLANNDNVHLLKPLQHSDNKLIPGLPVSPEVLHTGKHFLVIDYYIANTRLPALLELFATSYLSFRKEVGLPDCMLWVSELAENDFPALPVFQDKNLLVTITRYNDEQEYLSAQKRLDEALPTAMRNQLRDIITTQQTLLLYPTESTINNKETAF
jgi:hypothetical protein